MNTLDIRNPVFQRLALIVGIAVFVVITFQDSYESMWALWQTNDHRYGVLVIPISAFLVWQLRYQLVGPRPVTDWRGLLIVLPLAIIWIIARLVGVQVVEHFIALAMIPATLLTLTGPGITGKILFPLLFILFATPLGESLVPYLMVITADISAGLLRISGIPVMRDGQYMSLPGGDFVVADVCAGLRYLVSGVMIALLYSYLTYKVFRKRLVFVATTAVAMILTNGLRAYIVMAVASATRMQYFAGRDHIYFGWLMFGVVIIFIMWFGSRYADDEEPSDSGPTTSSSGNTSYSTLPLIMALGLVMLAVTVKPLQADFVGEVGAMVVVVAALCAFAVLLFRQKGPDDRDSPSEASVLGGHFGGRRLIPVLVTVVVLIMTPRIASTIKNEAVAGPLDLEVKATLPCTYSGSWQKTWIPGFGNADHEESGTYLCGGQPVSVYVASYASALQGKELVSSSHRIVPEDWDRISKGSTYTVSGEGGQSIRIGEIQVDGMSYKGLVWYWYEVDGGVATSSFKTKLYQVLALLLRRPAGGRVVVIESVFDGDIQAARDRLEPVARAILMRGVAARAAGSS